MLPKCPSDWAHCHLSEVLSLFQLMRALAQNLVCSASHWICIFCSTCLLCPSIYFMSNMLALPKHIFYVKHACPAQAYILCQTCLLCPSIYFMSNMSTLPKHIFYVKHVCSTQSICFMSNMSYEGIPGNINTKESNLQTITFIFKSMLQLEKCLRC
jgi:hypothetical protein